MLEFLKDHPFAVEAFFRRSVVLTFAAPVEQLRPLLPLCLEPDSFNERWAFAAVAMVQTSKLRPKGFPGFMGNDFFLAGFRIFVRYRNAAGKRLRGLYILQSLTDKPKMKWLGNIFTHYNYSTTDILFKESGAQTQIVSAASGIDICVEEGNDDIALPEGSPFGSWKEARRFAGPLPFTFTFNAARKEVLIIEGVRQHWEPLPLKVLRMNLELPGLLQNKDLRLANAFVVKNIPYNWKKGKKELWKG